MGQILRLIIHDHVTGEEWRTPEHNDNKKKDDYHNVIKPELKKLLTQRLRDILGSNGDFEIEDGEIIYVSQRINKNTGKKSNISRPTGIPADYFFERISFMLLHTTFNFALKYKVKLTIEIDPTEKHTFVVSVEL